jgi:hypothetical protein
VSPSVLGHSTQRPAPLHRLFNPAHARGYLPRQHQSDTVGDIEASQREEILPRHHLLTHLTQLVEDRSALLTLAPQDQGYPLNPLRRQPIQEIGREA